MGCDFLAVEAEVVLTINIKKKLTAVSDYRNVTVQGQIKDLIYKGIKPKLFSIVSEELIEVHRSSYLGRRINRASQNDLSSSSYSQLHALGVAVNNFILPRHNPWVIEKIREICREIKDNQDEIAVISKSASELICSGLLVEVFHNLKPLVEAKKGKTPDLLIGDNKYVEVYCPQESQPEKEKIKELLEKQKSMVRTVISRPITGSNNLALAYPANKTIDKVLNHKWLNDQTVDGAENILWVDLMNGFQVSSLKVTPYESSNRSDQTYTGSFGIWHAFYGKKDVSTFAPERLTMKYINETSGFYKQKKEGIFRSRKSLSAALLLTTDGIVLLENPWALVPIEQSTKQSIRKIYRFRPEFSCFGSYKNIDENEIDSILSKIEWLYEKR